MGTMIENNLQIGHLVYCWRKQEKEGISTNHLFMIPKKIGRRDLEYSVQNKKTYTVWNTSRRKPLREQIEIKSLECGMKIDLNEII